MVSLLKIIMHLLSILLHLVFEFGLLPIVVIWLVQSLSNGDFELTFGTWLAAWMLVTDQLWDIE